MNPQDRVIVALDVPGQAEACRLVDSLKGTVRWFKVGLELFHAAGPEVLELIVARGCEVFLDLKFHDIPHAVSRAAAVVTRNGVGMFDVHAAGGREMMRRAAEAARETATRTGRRRPLVLAVTVLTSIDAAMLATDMGVSRGLEDQVVYWARLAKEAGLDGVVASAHEAPAVREACGADFLIVTPGIRPARAPGNDQRRIVTPAEAARAGADFLVIGRPVTGAPDPREAAERIVDELGGAHRCAPGFAANAGE